MLQTLAFAFFFFLHHWDLNSEPVLARRALYHLRQPRPFCFYSVGSHGFCPASLDCDPPTFTSHVARITGESHHALSPDFHFFNYQQDSRSANLSSSLPYEDGCSTLVKGNLDFGFGFTYIY
jgi:hypothetical protein